MCLATMVFENAQDRKDTWLMDDDEVKITYETFEKVGSPPRTPPLRSAGVPPGRSLPRTRLPPPPRKPPPPITRANRPTPDGHTRKAQNCGTAIIKKEDHTVGNLVRQQLLNYSDVRFAAYQIPHPLDHRLFVRVQTADDTSTPMTALQRSLEDLHDEFSHLEDEFNTVSCPAFARCPVPVPGALPWDPPHTHSHCGKPAMCARIRVRAFMSKFTTIVRA